jgi:hypothetical protein
MTRRTKGYLTVTRSHEDSDGNVTAEWELRIHYILYPGCEAQLYGDAPHPSEEPLAELDFVQVETARGGKLVWDTTFDPDMIEWAEAWLADNQSNAFDDAADEAERAAEYRGRFG